MTTQQSNHVTISARSPWRLLVLSAAAVLLLGGCAAGEMNRRQGMALLDDGHLEEGLAQLQEALRRDPTNPEIRRDYLRQRESAFNRLIGSAAIERRAERYDAAEAIYRRILAMDGSYAPARQGLAEMETDRRHTKLIADAQALAKKGDVEGARARLNLVLVESPTDVKANQLRYQLEEATLKENIAGPTLNIKGRKPVTLQFRDANLKMVLEAISRTTGVNILLDKDVRNDIKVTIFVKDTPVEETLDLILLQNQLEKRVLGENTVLVYPFNPAKSKDYQELKVRRFALTNADPKQVQNMVKTIIKTKDVFVDEKTNAIVIRDTPQAIRLAEKLVAAMDQAEPEVLLEVEILEVTRNWITQIGIDWPTSASWSWKPGGTTAGAATWQAFKNRTGADIAYTIGSLAVTASQNKDDDIKTLAAPRIRARNKEKAKILIGRRLPVIATTVTAVAGATTPIANTNIQYLEVGTKLEVEPLIHLDNSVGIKLNLEVSDVSNTTTLDSGTVAYTTVTSNASTVLQLQDGETQILGGLIQRRNANSLNGKGAIPGLVDIPILGRLFGSQQDDRSNSEIVLAITPHIIRNSQVSEADLLEMWSGTESNIKTGAPNLRVSGTSGVIGQQGAAAAPAAPLARPGMRAAIQQSQTAAAPAGPLAMTLAGPQQAKVGDKINVIVNAQGTGIGAVNFALHYDTDALKAVAVSEGDMMRRANLKAAFDGQIDEAGGTVTADLTAEGGAVASAGGSVAVIQFEVVGGNGPVTLNIAGATAAGGSGSATTVTTPPPFIMTIQGQ